MASVYTIYKTTLPYFTILHNTCRLLLFALFLPSLLFKEYNESIIPDVSSTIHFVSKNRSVSFHSDKNTTSLKWIKPTFNISSISSNRNISILKTEINMNHHNVLSKRHNIHRLTLEVDHNFAKKLRLAQKNKNVPLVNDIIVSKRNNSWAVYVIINNGNTRSRRYNKYSSYNVELFLNGTKYNNVFSQVREGHLRVLKYEIPSLPSSGTVSLYDRTIKVRYENLPYRALMSQPKRKIAVCAYISNYNTVNEIKSLLAYYILQEVDNVILYCTVKCHYFQQALQLEIQSGYVILYEYPWPLTKKWKFTQLSIQGSHINSCYYRHRDFYKYIISQDVDEYFYSEQYPYDLYKAIQRIFTINPGKQTLAVFLYYGVNCRRNRLCTLEKRIEKTH